MIGFDCCQNCWQDGFFVTNFVLFFAQGIDINHKNDRKVRRTEPKSQDVYLRLLVKVSFCICLKSFVAQQSAKI